MAEVYIDGATTGNPGSAGCGVYVKQGGSHWQHSLPLPPMTSHEAEFWACIKALGICRDLGFPIVSLRSDSKALVDAVEKNYTSNDRVRPLLSRILAEMEEGFDHVFLKWIPSKQNGEADSLAKRAVRTSVAEGD
nr:ribonuclease HI family protein [Alkalicoccus chagannorensis]